ncbi:hypothetical protein ABIE65_002778 [Constrictibacter sp. MBR-5]|jgi:hypothetical protein
MLCLNEPLLAAQITDPRLRSLYLHWNDIRGARDMPARQAIDPVRIPTVLSIIFLCDYDADTERLRYRLAGEEIRGAYAREITGRYQDELFEGAERERHILRTRRVMRGPAILHASGEVYGFAGRRGMGERIGLPLSTDGKTADAVIGATAYRWTDVAPPAVMPEQRMCFSYWRLDGTALLDPS